MVCLYVCACAYGGQDQCQSFPSFALNLFFVIVTFINMEGIVFSDKVCITPAVLELNFVDQLTSTPEICLPVTPEP